MLAAYAAHEGVEPPSNSQQLATPDDWKQVEQAMGKSGAMQPGDVFKVSLPRSDLRVTVNGVQIKPALALGSWVAFKKMGDHTRGRHKACGTSRIIPVGENRQSDIRQRPNSRPRRGD
ncbi:MAG: DUF1259 domain-containing protein [Acidobacteria bacterium]|nr:DUF1259 domain-containing protein [Acidobacteriota bacterium]